MPNLGPSLARIRAAQDLLRHVLVPTPQIQWPLLCQRLGAEIWVKHENHLPTGAFKVRGGLVYLSDLADARAGHGTVIAATRGNHGQSVAFAASRLGLRSRIVVPHGNSAGKNAAMRACGAEVIEHGEDFQAAFEYAVKLAEAEKTPMVPSFHPLLVAGVATYALELLEAQPEIDVLYVPIGMGSGICGAISARDALGLSTEIVGVVAAGAPAYKLSFEAGRVVETPKAETMADGLACRVPNSGALAQMLEGASRVVAVNDDEIRAAMRFLFSDTHNAAEGAGAAALAAALKERSICKGKRVAIVLSGGNVEPKLFSEILAVG